MILIIPKKWHFWPILSLSSLSSCRLSKRETLGSNSVQECRFFKTYNREPQKCTLFLFNTFQFNWNSGSCYIPWIDLWLIYDWTRLPRYKVQTHGLFQYRKTNKQTNENEENLCISEDELGFAEVVSNPNIVTVFYIKTVSFFLMLHGHCS